MLRKIILENFMSHARTEIDLADGLNVLTGPNNCGKSAVVAALQVLATNGRTTHVMRHGEKRCRITVETDDGHTVIWERKNNTVKYTLDGEDIHRVKSATPPALHDLLRLDRVKADTGKRTEDYDIHFGEQKSPVFLLGDTGSRAASFFASSSDASRLVEMQHRHRANLRDRKSEAKRLQQESDQNEARLKSFEPLDEIALRLQHAKQIQAEVAENEQQSTALAERLGSLQQLAADYGSLRTKNETLSKLASPPIQHDAGALRGSIAALTRIAKHHAIGRRITDCCEALIPPPDLQPVEPCRQLVRQLGETQQSRELLRRVGKLLIPLRSAPEIFDTRAIRNQLAAICRLIQAQSQADSIIATMQDMRPTPPIESTEKLLRMINELSRRSRIASKLKRSSNAFESLQPPAESISADAIGDLIVRLQSQVRRTDLARAAATQAKSKQQACADAIRQFVADNPTCQTCGASIDPETLMSSAPSPQSTSHCEPKE